MKKCTEINELMSLYIDDAMDYDTRKEFEAHIRECKVCSEELQALQQLVDLCNDISEEELPEDFKAKLHERLLEEQKKEEKKNRFLILRSKYVQMAASIAAVAVIAIVLRGTLGNNFYPPTAQNKAMDLAAAEIGRPEEAKMEDTAADRSMKAVSPEKTSRAETTPKAADAGGTDAQEIITFSKTIDETGATTKGQSAANAFGVTQEPGNAGTGVQATASQLYAGAVNSAVMIASSEPEDAMERVRALAVSNQAAVFASTNEVSSNTPLMAMQAPAKEKQTETVAGTAEKVEDDGNTIRIRLMKDKAESFLHELQAGFGTDLAVDMVTVEASAARMEELKVQLNDIDNSLKDNDDNAVLLEQKEWAEQELQSLQNKGEYVFVTITVRQK